jgi:hypothetical protein
MNHEPWIRVERAPYEEPYHTHISISVSNGTFSGRTDLYCGVEELMDIGRALAQFPT